MKANNKIIIRLTTDQKRRVELLAEASGLNISQYTRKKILNSDTENMINELYKKFILEKKENGKNLQ